jgi:hypothetical protein
MRRSTFAIIVILFSSLLLTDISGQIPGLRIGVNNSSMLFTDTEVLDQRSSDVYLPSKMGFNAGFTLEIPVSAFSQPKRNYS